MSTLGRLGILFPGMGAVATTTMAGIALVRRGKAPAVGSLAQLGTVRPDSSTDAPPQRIADYAPLARPEHIVFGAWDIFPEDAFEVAERAQVLERNHLDEVEAELRAVRPMPGVFYPEYVKRLHGSHIKHASSKAEMVEQLRCDIRAFKRDRECERAVAIWCGSTEVLIRPTAVHAGISAFEDGLRRSDPAISNTQMYAWACIQEGVPFANASPNLAVDFPAAIDLALAHGVPIAGKDLKTGQTLLKTVLAAGLKARCLGLRGWFSANLLGNRDGAVLDEVDSFRAKEASKLGVLRELLEPEVYEQLYGDFAHKVRIDFYPPRGDAKEAWDNIDLFGWLGYPMQIKINFLGRDSILAAPLVLDLALFLDLAQRSSLAGTQDWLAFYFKSPMTDRDLRPEHDLSVQLTTLKNKLRWIVGEERSSQSAEPR
jgi:myo-inositol-1-phosphate synthase